MKKLTYPTVRKADIVDDFHGSAVADPYRWLEEAQSEETQAFVAAQNELSRAFLERIPALESIKERLTELWDYPKYSAPRRQGERYFFMLMEGLQNQPVLYTQVGLDGEPTAVLDPNTLSEDGTVAVTNLAFTKDGSHLAYALSSSGSDWQEIGIRNVETGEDYAEVLKWCKFAGVAWKPDRSGFFYDRNPEPGTVPPEEENLHNKLYWHALGAPQSDDVLVYARPDAPELHFPPLITEDGRYIVLNVWHGAIAKNRLYYRELESEGEFVRLIDVADAAYNFVGNDGDTFYVWTDLDAPHGRIVAIDLRQPAREKWCEIIPEQEDVIDFVKIVDDKFVVAYLHNAYHRLKVYALDGTYLYDISLPAVGSIVGLTGRREHTELFIAFQSFLYPTTLLRYDFTAGRLDSFRESQLDFDPAAYETQQVFCKSKDGTAVPMFITHKKGLKLDGENPTLLYGYGGFSVNLTPTFSLPRLAWLERGGVYAQVNLRGGNEFGDEWHRAGMLANKQNVFDDFIAAAEWLIDNGYTRPEKLGINGRSNGGLLVAAVMLQRPELFGAVVCTVPVIDMLRYHKFTAGRYWVPEYGNAEENPEHFEFLMQYSPLHNVKEGIAYPPVLIDTADTDDRVVPMHAYKFAAALQAAAQHANPILLRVETKAGHGLGKPTAKVIEEAADELAFLWHFLG